MKKAIIASLCLIPISGFAIYKGTPVEKPIWPMVSILDAVDGDGLTPKPESYPTRHFKGFVDTVFWPLQHDCAAELIATDPANNVSYLATAAHCVTTQSEAGYTADDPKEKLLAVGNSWCSLPENASVNASSQCEATSTTAPGIYTIKKFIISTPFLLNETSTMSYDFAIIVANGVLKDDQGNPIQPMSIASQIPQSMTQAKIAGWGTTEYQQFEKYWTELQSGDSSPTLMEMQYEAPLNATVNILNGSLCSAQQTALGYGSTQVSPDSTVCVGNPDFTSNNQQTADVCYGDSGGPLFTETQNGGYQLLGSLSHSPYLCAPTTYNPDDPKSQPVPADKGKPQWVPTYFSFWGAMLCPTGKYYGQKMWTDSSNPGGGIQSLQTLIPGFKPVCD